MDGDQMNGVEYFIWLQECLGAASAKLPALLKEYGTVRQFYEAGADSWRCSGLFTPRELQKLGMRELDGAYKIMEKSQKLGYDIITPDNPRYPSRLARIPNPPAVLYVCGNLPDVDGEVLISIVGTRSATPYGHQAAFKLSMQLAQAGAVVVSGGAVGIDSDAHTGALQVGGTTVAVLGCGINYPYLAQNSQLRKMIAGHGALVSEYPPDASPSRFTFPIRNRIISGLSLGVIVIEAGLKSGSLITADHALEQGRDVFAVSGGVMSPAYAGTNRLLRDGAKQVFSAYDVLSEYTHLYPNRLDLRGSDRPIAEVAPPLEPGGEPAKKTPQEAKKQPVQAEAPQKPQGLSPFAQKVYEAFCEPVMSMDALCTKSGLTLPQILQGVTELELAGAAVAVGGGRYRRAL